MQYLNSQRGKFPNQIPQTLLLNLTRMGREFPVFSNADIVSHSQSLWKDHYSNAGTHPIFMSLNLETPLALASFLGINSNLHKVVIPSTFSMTKILESLKVQGSTCLICDSELYSLEPPKH